MAGALTASGEIAQAMAMVEEALARCERDGELWCMAELLRIKGEFLRHSGKSDAAEAEFRRSLDWARRQDALSWELRTAASLAMLLRNNDRIEEARAVLTPVYQKFTEGFGTRDLVTAKRVLDAFG
jgi:predicted ATPase